MPELSDNARGALLMTAAMAAFTINDTLVKAASDELGLFQSIFLRGLGSSIFLFLLARAMGALNLRLSARDWILVGLRSLGEIGAAFLFITALFHMPLANVTAILQALPLSITLAGALFLGEAVGWRRLTAILIGLAGVLLIVRPGPEGFNSYSLYALAAVAAVTVRDLATRRLSPQTPSMTVALVAAVGVTLFSGIGCLGGDCAEISPKAALQIGAATGFLILGYICSVMVMRAGDIGFVAPFRYTGLLWALVLGFVVFGDWPAPLTLLGAGIVTATGVFTLYRERKVARPGPETLRVR